MSYITISDPDAKPKAAKIRQPDAVELALNVLSAVATTIGVVETFARGEDISYLAGERPLNKRRYVSTITVAAFSGVRIGGLVGAVVSRARGKQLTPLEEIETQGLAFEALTSFALASVGAAELAGLKTFRRRGKLSGFGKVGAGLALSLAAYRTVVSGRELYRRYRIQQTVDAAIASMPESDLSVGARRFAVDMMTRDPELIKRLTEAMDPEDETQLP